MIRHEFSRRYFMGLSGVGVTGLLGAQLPFGSALVLLRHKFLRPRTIARVLQYGHRGRSFTSASMIRMRMVAIEFGMFRSGRKGGSSGSVTVG